MRRSRRLSSSSLLRRPWQVLLLAALLAVFAALRWRDADFSGRSAPATVPSQTSRIERVVDGDTLILAGSKDRVRLIGADTPETVKPNWPVERFGPEASAFTKAFIASGEVRLESDGDPRDRYGRRLAYVWVGDRMLNEELLKAGLARARLQYNFSAAMKDRFRRAEAEAKAEKRGIWSE